MNQDRFVFFMVALWTLVAWTLVALFPVISDEAYYFAWGHRSSWEFGFFDHPPIIGWIARVGVFFDSIRFARFIIWSLATGVFFLVFRLGVLELKNKNKAFLAALVSMTSLGGYANSFLLTPDAPLAFFWVLALHEAYYGLHVNPRRWLTAGVATGFGLLTKYTMVLIGVVFLSALLAEKKHKLLRTRWPYLGGLAALLVFLPNLWWQSHHDWVSFRFQWNHGLSTQQSALKGSSLTQAYPMTTWTPEITVHTQLLEALDAATGRVFEPSVPRPPKLWWQKALRNIGDYWGGVVGLWGLYGFLFLAALFKKIRNDRKYFFQNMRDEIKQLSPLICASAMTPLVFFALLSPFSKIEANWPALSMSTLGIVALGLGGHSGRVPRREIGVVASIHAAGILVCILVMQFFSILPTEIGKRLLVESAGYQQVAEWLKSRPPGDVLVVDTYQLRAQLARYLPEQKIVQWPGITRFSEFSRGHHDDVRLEQEVITKDYFYLLSSDGMPRRLPGYQAKEQSAIYACASGELAILNVEQPVSPCSQVLQGWWWTKYERVAY